MSDLARLAGVTRLALAGRGPSRAWVFDPHRLALPCWAEALEGTRAVIVTLDRHLDLVPPVARPRPSLSVQELDTFARLELDIRNVDFILAAMEAGLISHAIVVARARPVGCLDATRWTDSRGEVHELVIVPTVDALAQDFGTPRATPEGKTAATWLAGAEAVLLDVDVDCFTSPSDADPTTVLPWPLGVIRDHVLPRGSEAFWSAVLSRCAGLTIAREAGHTGGLVENGRLFEAVAQVLFVELLGTDLP